MTALRRCAVAALAIACALITLAPTASAAAERHDVALEGLVVAPGGTTVTLLFAGTQDTTTCRAGFRVSIKEKPRTIGVRITSSRKLPPFRVCPRPTRSLTVTLTQPFGQRVVVDKATRDRWEWGTGGYVRGPCTDDVPCSPREPDRPAAACNDESYRDAVFRGIDRGDYELHEPRCDGSWLQVDVDLGSDACPPETTPEEQAGCRNTRVDRTYWAAQGRRWLLLVVGPVRDECATVQALVPTYPSALCAPAA